MSQASQTFQILNEDRDAFSSIRAAEVCSIETAKGIGLFDADKYYHGGDATNIRTFSSAVANDATRTYSLCKENPPDDYQDKERAQPLCSLMSPGLVPKEGGTCGRPDGECPPGFTFEPATGECRKPIQNIMRRREEMCDEQWHDWFTLPNYSLNNRYEKVNGVCHQPCPANTLPGRGTDPVTGKDRGKANIAKCVDKTEYLGGKFGGDSDYCNLAWIKRLSVKLPELGDEYLSHYPTFATNGSKAMEMAANEGAAMVIASSMKGLENLNAHSENMEKVCRNRVDTTERLTEAYAICENINRNGPAAQGQYISQVRKTLKALYPTMAMDKIEKDVRNRYKVLKQACHYTFCDKDKADSDRANIIGKPALCFSKSDIERIALKEKDSLTTELESTGLDYPEAYIPGAPAAEEKRVVQRTSMNIINALFIMMAVIVIGSGIYFIIKGILNNQSVEEEIGSAHDIIKKHNATPP